MEEKELNKKAEEFQQIVINSLSNDVTEISRENIKLKEENKKLKDCLNEIIDYMNDDTVYWRDITDDIINEILKKYGYK